MQRWISVLTVFILAACANLNGATDKTQRSEEQFAGEHAALAACVVAKLQSDGRSFLRPLQFKNRKYPDMHASEIHAYDTRYLRSAIATYAPSNPDAILIYGNPALEIQSAAQRNDNDKPVYAFALLLQQADNTKVTASLRGDPFFADIAWKIMELCVAATAKP
ncbi:hypothetical protein R2103_01075 [Nitrosomonas sp. Is24]|uniref:hypothetical protein n=1 Tax=Nitrosomonas sp. Is24 TaxID=3080533 RepID=UPI00294AFCC3|nr:hypothetical protein [Nitrosomonas sp. Is24]MDV6340364.1 hypothetical protein [Nitrosomonas sp. Is24]